MIVMDFWHDRNLLAAALDFHDEKKCLISASMWHIRYNTVVIR